MSDLINRIKPCPCCGSTNVHTYNSRSAQYRQYSIKCMKCGLRVCKATLMEAKEVWNCRTEPEPKKGKWVYKPDEYDDNTYECSQCGEPWTLIDGTPEENNMKFCPNCGAKLEWE